MNKFPAPLKITLLIISIIFILILKGNVGNFDNLEIYEYKDPKVFFDYSGSIFEISTVRARFSQILSLAESGNYNLNEEYEEFVKPDVGYHEDRVYGRSQHGVSIIALPFYYIGHTIQLGQVFSYLTTVIISIINALLIFKLSNKKLGLSIESSSLATFVYSIGSIALMYTGTLMQHQHVTLILLLLTIFYFKYKESGDKNILYISSTIYGLSAFIDYSSLIIALPIAFSIFLIAFKEIRYKTIKYVLPLFIIITVILIQNWSLYGNPIQTSNGLSNKKIENIANVENKNIETQKSLFGFKNVDDGLKILLTDSRNGMLIFMPFTILSLIEFLRRLKKNTKDIDVILITVFIFTIFYYSLFSDSKGGHTLGPRYLIPILPFLSIYFVMFIDNIKNVLVKLLSYILVYISILNSITGALTSIAIPSYSESRYMGIKNLDLVFNNISSSFIYNILPRDMPLTYYYILILTIVTTMYIYLIKLNSDN